MANITKDQVKKFNDKCKNGFGLDIYFFCCWNDKRCKKNIQLDGDSNLYEVIIEFVDECKNFAKIGSKPVFIINKCIPTGTNGMYSVHEIHREEVGEMVKRKSVKILQDLTEKYTDEKLFNMVKELAA